MLVWCVLVVTKVDVGRSVDLVVVIVVGSVTVVLCVGTVLQVPVGSFSEFDATIIKQK